MVYPSMPCPFKSILSRHSHRDQGSTLPWKGTGPSHVLRIQTYFHAGLRKRQQLCQSLVATKIVAWKVQVQMEM
jgi:hypothetical protein